MSNRDELSASLSALAKVFRWETVLSRRGAGGHRPIAYSFPLHHPSPLFPVFYPVLLLLLLSGGDTETLPIPCSARVSTSPSPS